MSADGTASAAASATDAANASSNKIDKRSVFILGNVLPASELPPEGGEVERKGFLDPDNTSILMRILAGAFGVKSAREQYDVEAKAAGVLVVFDKDAAAKDCVRALDGEKFLHFRLSVKRVVEDDEDDGAGNAGGGDAEQPNPLLPHNHRMPDELQLHPSLLARLTEEKHAAMLKPLLDAQARAMAVQQQIDDARSALEAKRLAASGASAAGAASAEAAAAADAKDIVGSVAAPAASAADAVKRCVYFPSVPLAASHGAAAGASTPSSVVGALLSAIVVTHKMVVRRWAFAATPRGVVNSSGGSSVINAAALVVELQSEAAANRFLQQLSRGKQQGGVASLRVGGFEFQPVAATVAVGRGWIAEAGAFPLPPHDVRALFGSREADEALRDLKAALRL